VSDFREESNVWIIAILGWFGFAFDRMSEWIRDMPNVTILIVARNAASTIDRAMRSAVGQGDCPIVMVDDASSDDTVALAKAVGLDRLRVVSVESHSQLGAARQLGLESIDTEYCVLLDADDELLPGRVERLVETMQREGTDAVFDEIELWEESENRFLRTLPIPCFLKNGGSLCRLFERNYLPGIGQMGFRSAFFQAVRYDREVHGPEDTDIVLRALVAGGTFSLLREVGYRMYHGELSVSRNLVRQNSELKRVLEKHSYERVAELYREAGYSERISLWGRHSLATFRGDGSSIRRFLAELECEGMDPECVLEPDGPMPMGEGWRLAFARGSLCLLEGDATGALDHFRGIVSEGETAEVLNNVGVAEALLGNPDRAREFFEKSLDRFPGYADATANLQDSKAPVATWLPLRRQPSRDFYTR
jgi:glycosyltransferase involved in cell wall biosynthesis